MIDNHFRALSISPYHQTVVFLSLMLETYPRTGPGLPYAAVLNDTPAAACSVVEEVDVAPERTPTAKTKIHP